MRFETPRRTLCVPRSGAVKAAQGGQVTRLRYLPASDETDGEEPRLVGVSLDNR